MNRASVSDFPARQCAVEAILDKLRKMTISVGLVPQAEGCISAAATLFAETQLELDRAFSPSMDLVQTAAYWP